MTTQTAIEQLLSSYQDPYLKQSLLSSHAVKKLQVSAQLVQLELVLGYPLQGIAEQMELALRQLLSPVLGEAKLEIKINWEITSHAVQAGVKPLPAVKNIIAIASGKGGVGKSTSAVNLALALALEGANVGILDADIYGPNQPQMLGVPAHTRPDSNDGQHLEPIVRYGLQSMSIGYLVDAATPMVWRGPMVTSALQQLLHDTHWQNLDYLIIDLPPGTGDVQLTLAQKIPVSAAVIITTPQEVALLDARKAIAMFQKVQVPVLGVIENMSTHQCSQCGHIEAIFGQGGGTQLAQEYQLELLGSLPLAAQIRQQSDGGQPTVIAEPTGILASTYRDIARRIAAKLSLQAKSYAHKFPNIVVENR